MYSNINDKEYDLLMSGNTIYGDDFSQDEINQWFEDEKNASMDCFTDADADQYDFLNHFHSFKNLHEDYDTCLVLGPADGSELKQISHKVKKFYAIEPEKLWWKKNINSVPCKYFMPNPNGKIDLNDNSIDLIISFSVLHHIPNVSFIISEFDRVLKPGGKIIFREPIVDMGDWRKKRTGLTPRERGIPLDPFIKSIIELKFNIKSIRFYDIPVTKIIAKIFGIKSFFNKPFFVILDYYLCKLISWKKVIYNRKKLIHKIQPSSVYIEVIKS